MTTIFIPEVLKKGVNLNIARELFSCQDEDELTIDFGLLRWSYPVSLMKTGMYIRKLVSYRKARGLKTYHLGIASNGTHDYLKHIGFFDFIKLPIGNDMGAARGSRTYLPITEITRAEIEEKSTAIGCSIQDSIVEKAREVSRIVFGYESDDVIDLLTYSLKEIIRNVFEHSKADSCFLFVQKYKGRRGLVQLAILDEGIGISESLKHSQEGMSEELLIKKALDPGITCANLEDPNSINSGYGLYALSEIGRKFGWFEILSGQKCIQITEEYEVDRNYPSFGGTFIGLNINPYDDSFSQVLEDIIEDGEQLANQLGSYSRASFFSRSINHK